MSDELQSVQQAIRVLRHLAQSGPMGITHLAGELSLSTSTAHRLVKTLLIEGAVVRSPGGRAYALAEGISFPPVKSDLRRLLDAAPPIMERLRDATQETVHIAVLTGTSIKYAACVESTLMMRVTSRAGETAPAHLSAAGKVLLSRRGNPEVVDLFPQNILAKATEYSIGTRDELLAELARARQTGYARNVSESEHGMYALAVPLSTRSKSGLAALTISGPEPRILPAPPGSERLSRTEEKLLELLKAASSELEAVLAR